MRLRRRRNDVLTHFVAHLERPHDLEYVLEHFEIAFAEHTGEELTTSEFFDRYRAGEFDSPFGMAWADYYEAYLSMSGHEGLGQHTRDLAATLPRVYA